MQWRSAAWFANAHSGGGTHAVPLSAWAGPWIFLVWIQQLHERVCACVSMGLSLSLCVYVRVHAKQCAMFGSWSSERCKIILLDELFCSKWRTSMCKALGVTLKFSCCYTKAVFCYRKTIFGWDRLIKWQYAYAQAKRCLHAGTDPLTEMCSD